MKLLKSKISENVATITINAPPANTLSSHVLKELSHLLDELEENDHARVILIHGEGRFFSAGADIKEFTSIESGEEFSQLATYGQQLFERMENFPKPIIASIHGAALGGGLELAMGCHIRFVTENAKLGLPELQLGLVPGFAGSQRLSRYVGFAKAAELLFTSEPITGKEAVQLGLANQAFAEEALLDEAYVFAKKIAKKSPVSVRATIELLNASKPKEFQTGVKREAQLFGEVFMSDDAKEGISAFIEKREPHFKGK